MPYRIAFVQDLGAVVLRLSGDITPDEIERSMDEIPAQPWFRPHLKMIVDARQCTTAMTGKDVQWLAAYAKRVEPAWGDSKWAILAASDLIYGLSRVYMALTADYRIKTHVFRSAKETDDWLGLGTSIEEALRLGA